MNALYFDPIFTSLDTGVAPPDREEVAMAIQRLKPNKASGYDGLPAEQEELS